MLFIAFCNFAFMALAACNTSTLTNNHITRIPTLNSSDTAITGRWLSNEDVLKIQLAKRHAMRIANRFDVSKNYANAMATMILQEALDLPIFREKIHLSDPLLQKLKQEKEQSDNNPQASLSARCSVCGGTSISTCRCAKEAQRRYREEYYNVE
jgi:hypothetical protein